MFLFQRNQVANNFLSTLYTVYYDNSDNFHKAIQLLKLFISLVNYVSGGQR